MEDEREAKNKRNHRSSIEQKRLALSSLALRLTPCVLGSALNNKVNQSDATKMVKTRTLKTTKKMKRKIQSSCCASSTRVFGSDSVTAVLETKEVRKRSRESMVRTAQNFRIRAKDPRKLASDEIVEALENSLSLTGRRQMVLEPRWQKDQIFLG